MIQNNQEQSPGFFDRAATKKWLWIMLWTVCGLSVIAELFLHRHGHFGGEGGNSIDGWFGFYALLGFASCFGLILLSKLFGIFLKKDPEYYDGSD